MVKRSIGIEPDLQRVKQNVIVVVIENSVIIKLINLTRKLVDIMSSYSNSCKSVKQNVVDSKVVAIHGKILISELDEKHISMNLSKDLMINVIISKVVVDDATIYDKRIVIIVDALEVNEINVETTVMKQNCISSELDYISVN